MALNILFAVIGAFFGLSQYVITKITGKAIAGGKKEEILYSVITKFVIYGLLIAAMLLFFEKWLVWCLGGLATGIIIACIVDTIKSKKSAK